MITIKVDDPHLVTQIERTPNQVLTFRERISAFREVRMRLHGKKLSEEYALGELADEALSLLQDESGFWIVARCSDFRIKYIVAVFSRFEDASDFFVNALTERPKLGWRRIFHQPLHEQVFHSPLQLQALIRRLQADVADAYLVEDDESGRSIEALDPTAPPSFLQIRFREIETDRLFMLFTEDGGRSGGLHEISNTTP